MLFEKEPKLTENHKKELKNHEKSEHYPWNGWKTLTIFAKKSIVGAAAAQDTPPKNVIFSKFVSSSNFSKK